MELLCKNCTHKRICAFKKEFNETAEKAESIDSSLSLNSPIKTNIVCSSYVNDLSYRFC